MERDSNPAFDGKKGVVITLKRQVAPLRCYRKAWCEAGSAARLPNAIDGPAKSQEKCIHCLKLPESHRSRARTRHTLNRSIEEAKRRTKVIGFLAWGRSGWALIHAMPLDVPKRWRGINLTAGDLEQLNAP